MSEVLDKDGLKTAFTAIKTWTREELVGKAGVFYADNISGNTLVFADEASKEAYLADQSKTELLLGIISGGTGGGGATGEYRVAVNLLSSMYNAVSLGSKGHYIRFTFDVLNESGMSTGEPVIVTYKIARGGNTSEYKEVYRYGSNVAFNVDKYINEGTNIVTINIMGQTSLVSTTFAVTFDVINITLSDYLDISKVYNLSNNGTDYMEIPYDVSGTYTKLMEWYIDGVQLEFNRTDDEILETVPVSRTKTIELSNLSQGRHNLQFRVGSKINGEMFYSDVLYRDFFVYTGVNDNFMMGVATAIPSSYGILIDGLVIHDMVQYVGYNLKVASYSPINTAKTDIAISLDNELVGNVTSRNGLVTDVIIVATTDGSKTLKLSTEETEYLIPTEVSVTDMTLSEITSGLKLNFTARGRNNNSSDKEIWTDGTTTATLTGFQWNNQSGWVNDRLEISENAELHIEYAPLSSHDNGKTIEVEWSSKNVSDENAVLCDLRNDNGTGILITATSVVVTSANNVTLERRYKSDENVRMSIVVNPNRGTNKGLTFIYINGVISGAINVVEGDNYISNKDIIFKGSTGAIVSLKSIRVYDVALSTEQILNNFNLYRDTLSEMLDVYNRNSIYDGNLYDTSKMAGRLPVMIVTGEIPTLENTNDKDTQIIVDIEYINMQDTTRNFTMKNAAMRPQGTSSMGYPKKNFRIYTHKIDSTELIVNGKTVEDKLYSFKGNAIPVDCWCLKADYAESSGTHNVGVARMWGDAFKNAQVSVDLGVDNPHNLNNAYALRTTAQQKAIDNGYKYDVRTTIDGFPILLFYRRTPESDIIFLGKYNFNNDKSTEKVFGFTDIPGFDNTRMQCWELLNNGNPIGLFTDISDFYNDVTVDGKVMKGWQAAFESRYPDTKTPNTNDLYDFVTWVNGVDGEAKRFAEEKWNHLDVYKVAGYYCYLMRHGAADQFVKNAMLTSEDGEHFYFILYDNDTINGLNNTGDIAILPTDNRESVYANGSHKFAGYDSVLWNMLEGDEEFTQIVQAVDNALYSAGISYKNAISMFDEQQADKWVERVYNLDAEYKYISPYTNNGTNNLFMLQGDREIHRKWWLSNRYSLYDSLFVSGAYKSGYVEIKCLDETQPGQTFRVTSGYPIYYGYGINGKLRQRTITPLAPNSFYEFNTYEKVNLGDPIAIYGAPHIKELNLSTMSDRISVLQLAGVYDEALGTKLEVLKVGSSSTENVTLKEISGIKSATALTHLDVTNMKGLTAIDLSNNVYLKELKAAGTNIASATFAVGAPIEHLVLPETFRTVKLSSLPELSYEGLELANINNVESFDINECPNLSNDFSWVYAWYQNKNVSNENAVLHMDNVDWTDVDPDELVEIVNIGNLKLKGHVRINRGSQEIVDQLKEVFGETVFNKTSEFYIMAPDGVYLSGPSKLLEGESARYVVAAFSEENGRIQFSLPTTRQGCSIDATSGRLTTTENGLATSDIVVRAVFITDSGKVVDTTMNVTIEKRMYPTKIDILGDVNVNKQTQTYSLVTTPSSVTGNFYTIWSLSSEASGFLEIESSSKTSCVLKRLKEDIVVFSLTATIYKVVDDSKVLDTSKTLSLVLEGVVLTISANEHVQRALYSAGLVGNENYSYSWELALLTDEQLCPTGGESVFSGVAKNITHFEEFQYFSGCKNIGSNYKQIFYNFSNLKTLILPPSIEHINSMTSLPLDSINIPRSVLTMTPANSSTVFKSSCKIYAEDLESLIKISLVNSSGYSFFANPGNLFIDGKPFSEREIILSDVIPGQRAFAGANFNNVTVIANTDVFQNYGVFTEASIDSVILNGNTLNASLAIFANASIGNLTLNISELTGTIKQSPDTAFYYAGINNFYWNNSIKINDEYFYNTRVNNFYISSLENWLNSTLLDELYVKTTSSSMVPYNDSTKIFLEGEEIPSVLEIPEGTTKLGKCCFYKWYFEEVHIPSSVSEIELSAFRGCLSLSKVNVHENNLMYDSRDNCNAVVRKSDDKIITGGADLTIPLTVKDISSRGFIGIKFNKSINLHSGLTISSDSAYSNIFVGCEIPELRIDTSLPRSNSFAGCLCEKVIVGPSCKSLAWDAISINTNSSIAGYTVAVTINELHIEDLESYLYLSNASSFNKAAKGNVFYNNALLTTVTIETDVNANLRDGLSYLTYLEEVTLVASNSNTSPVIRDCPSLSKVSIHIPKVKQLTQYFLSNNPKLKTLSMLNTNAPTSEVLSFGRYDTDFTGRDTKSSGENILYVPQGATGYDTSYWLDPLQNPDKCGFTISYTL